MNLKELLASDLDNVFMNVDEFATKMLHTLDENEPETFIVIFDLKTEVILDDEVVDTQPSILVKEEIEQKIKNRSVLLIEGKEYRKSHDVAESLDLVRIFLERA